MIAALTIALRFGLYLDLMLLFGVPAFALYNFRQHPADLTPAPVRTVVLVAAGNRKSCCRLRRRHHHGRGNERR